MLQNIFREMKSEKLKLRFRYFAEIKLRCVFLKVPSDMPTTWETPKTCYS